MNTKFTPGPWKAVPWHIAEGPSEVRAKEGWLICQTSSDANAHLIAASPEIGALLAQAVRLYEAYGLVAGSPECGKWVNDSRNALKKAGF